MGVKKELKRLSAAYEGAKFNDFVPESKLAGEVLEASGTKYTKVQLEEAFDLYEGWSMESIEAKVMHLLKKL